MTFFHPLAWLWLLLVPLLLLLYVLRQPQAVRWVSNLYLWQHSGAHNVARVRVARLQRNWLMALQVLFLLLGVSALAQPALFLHRPPPRDFVWIFDASASMQVVEDEHSRFAKAQETALTLLESLGAYDRIMLMRDPPSPHLTADFLTDKHMVRHLIQALSPTDAAGDLPAALLFARAAAPPEAEIYILSDGAGRAALAPSSSLDAIHYIQIGASADNVAISRLEARQHPFSPYDQEIYAEVINFSEHHRTLPLTLTVGSTPLTTAMLSLAPGGRQSVVAPYHGSTPEIVTAQIPAGDGLAVDNHAYAILPVPRDLSVLLVSPGNFFLEQALHVYPEITIQRISPQDYAQGRTPQTYDVMVYDGFTPVDLPAGRYIILPSSPPQEIINPGASDRPLLSLSVTLPRHPIMAFIDTASLSIAGARPLRLPPESLTLLEAGGYPVLAAYEREALKAVFLGFSIQDSPLSLTVAFPILISNIFQWLTSPTELEIQQIAPGKPFDWLLPPSLGLDTVSVTTPRGVTVHTPLKSNQFVFSDTTVTGVYTVRAGTYTTNFVVNLFDEAESDIRPVFSPPGSRARDTHSPKRQVPHNLWPYCVLAALTILVLEWVWDHHGMIARWHWRGEP
jgi:Ca-activated chloride channel homolog